MDYVITIIETLKRSVLVKAASSEEAITAVKFAYGQGEIVLDSGDYDNYTEFKDETKKHPKRGRGNLPALADYIKQRKRSKET